MKHTATLHKMGRSFPGISWRKQEGGKEGPLEGEGEEEGMWVSHQTHNITHTVVHTGIITVKTWKLYSRSCKKTSAYIFARSEMHGLADEAI